VEFSEPGAALGDGDEPPNDQGQRQWQVAPQSVVQPGLPVEWAPLIAEVLQGGDALVSARVEGPGQVTEAQEPIPPVSRSVWFAAAGPGRCPRASGR